MALLGFFTENERGVVRRELGRDSPEDAQDIESLVFLGKKELEMLLAKKTTRRKRIT